MMVFRGQQKKLQLLAKEGDRSFSSGHDSCRWKMFERDDQNGSKNTAKRPRPIKQKTHSAVNGELTRKISPHLYSWFLFSDIRYNSALLLPFYSVQLFLWENDEKTLRKERFRADPKYRY